jgi:hypothetical protein
MLLITGGYHQRVLRMIQIPTLDQTENPHDALTIGQNKDHDYED